MTKVLVASASRHGATTEIADAIGDILRAQGLEVDVREMDAVDTVYPYDAYVLGSAVYIGSWLHSARDFIDEHWELLATRPTWLFSSAPTWLIMSHFNPSSTSEVAGAGCGFVSIRMPRRRMTA